MITGTEVIVGVEVVIAVTEEDAVEVKVKAVKDIAGAVKIEIEKEDIDGVLVLALVLLLTAMREVLAVVLLADEGEDMMKIVEVAEEVQNVQKKNKNYMI